MVKFKTNSKKIRIGNFDPSVTVIPNLQNLIKNEIYYIMLQEEITKNSLVLQKVALEMPFYILFYLFCFF